MSDYYEKVTRERTLTPEDEAMISGLLRSICECSCHDCCIPRDQSCEDCEDAHG